MKNRVSTLAGILALWLCAPAQAQTKSYWIDIDSNFISGTDSTGPITTEAGWTSLDAAGGENSQVTIDGISFRVASIDGSRVRVNTNGSLNPNNLTGDFIFDDGANQALVLYFGGAGSLPAGPWKAEVWAWDATSPMGDLKIGYRTSGAETIVNQNAQPHQLNPALTFIFESNGTSVYDVFIRENNSQDRTRMNAVRLTRVSATDITLDPGSVSPAQAANSLIGSLLPVSTWTSSGYAFSLVPGPGDTHNSEFAVSGSELHTSATFPNTHTFGELLSVRVRITDADFGFFEGQLTIPVIPIIYDSDGNGLDDDWELQFFAPGEATAQGHNDGDSLTNAEEFNRNTFPNDEDSDDDGLNDDIEDNDRIFNGALDPGTNPRDDDTDDDNVKDGQEIMEGTNPLVPDTDGDGLNDGGEKDAGTNPLIADSDGDGISDGAEVVGMSDPLNPGDPSTRSLLTAYWPLDIAEGVDPDYTTPDLGPGAYDMNLNNMTPANFISDGGRIVASFNGTDTMLTRMHNLEDALPIGKYDGYTVSAWVKVKGTGQNDRRFFSEGSTTSSSPLLNLGTHNTGVDDRVGIYLRSIMSTHEFSTGTALDAQWHHVVLTSNSLNNKTAIYIDGVLDRDDLTHRDLRTAPLDNTTIGGILRDIPSHWVNGLVDDVALWRGILSAADIASLYEGTSPLSLGLATSSDFFITSISRNSANNQITLTWKSKPTKKYTVRFSANLQGDPRNWGNIAEGIDSQGEFTTITDVPNLNDAPQRYYVIEELP